MENSLFAGLDINSIREEANLIEVDVPQKQEAQKEIIELNSEHQGKAPEDKDKNKNTENLIEVNTENPGEEENGGDAPSSKEQKKNPSLVESSSPFTSLASALQEEGILSQFSADEFDGSATGLFKLIENEIISNVNHYKNSLPKEVKELIENYEEGVPLDKFISTKSKEMEISNIKDEELSENADLQKKILSEYYTSKGIKADKIKKLIEKHEDFNELKDEATEALSELKEVKKAEVAKLKEEQRLQNEEYKRRNDEALKNLQKSVESTDEIIPGMKLNKNLKEKLFSSMTTPARFDEAGRPVNRIADLRAKDPVKFEMTLHYLAELGVFEGDWSKIKSTAKTNAAKDLEEKLKSTATFGGGNARKTTEDMSKNPILSSLKGMLQ